MIYDRALSHCVLPSGNPLTGKLRQVGVYLYADMTVYHKRYWESVQAGTSVDRIAALTGHMNIDSGDYCVLEDDRVYRVEQVQFQQDEFGLPQTVLSLHRTDLRYQLPGEELVNADQ